MTHQINHLDSRGNMNAVGAMVSASKKVEADQ